jgi:Uroporphyrinogen-III synthase HemD
LLDAVLAAISGPHDAAKIATEGDGGADALWPLRVARGPWRRALLLSAQSGREWLSEQLRTTGCEVTELAAYEPRAAVKPPWAAAWSEQQAANALAVLWTSSGAPQSLAPISAYWPALRDALALGTHQHIAEALAGCLRIELAQADAKALVARLLDVDAACGRSSVREARFGRKTVRRRGDESSR